MFLIHGTQAFHASQSYDGKLAFRNLLDSGVILALCYSASRQSVRLRKAVSTRSTLIPSTLAMHEIYIVKGGRESGPFTPDQIPSMLDSGMLSLKDSVWHQDLPEWIPVHRFLNLRPPAPEVEGSRPTAIASPVVKMPSRSGEPAQFGRRLGAALIDSIVFFVMASILTGAGFILLFGTDYDRTMTDGEINRIVFYPVVVMAWIYSAAMESGPWRATVGKLVFGIVVTDMGGKPLSFWRATRRYLWKTMGALTLGLTLLPAAWTRRRQNVHDLLSKTLVLRK